VVIVAAHPHRGEAFDACRYVIEELKKRVPIWKREAYATGELAWVKMGTQRRDAEKRRGYSMKDQSGRSIEFCGYR